MSFSRLADQRAQRPDSSILPESGYGAPVVSRPAAASEKTLGAARTAEERPAAALTAREERVKRILLKELGELGVPFNGFKGLSYAEKQRLEKRLDVDYLDREIARMEKDLRRTGQMKPWVITLCVVMGVFLAWSVFVQDWQHLTGLLTFPFVAFSLHYREKAVRRRLFIYEALRALSDADEIDVILDKATRDADRLIEQIVARELEAEARYGRAPRTR